MATTTVKVGSSATKVTVASGSAQRVVLDRHTVADIANNRPKTVTSRQSMQVKTGGGMGVQGPPGGELGLVLFYVADGSRSDIPLTASKSIPFFLADGSEADIPLAP